MNLQTNYQNTDRSPFRMLSQHHPMNLYIMSQVRDRPPRTFSLPPRSKRGELGLLTSPRPIPSSPF